MAVITALDVVDVRFPTSRMLDGSDAMNPDPDYSAAYVTIRTDDGGADGSGDGYGLVFTIGRGNDVAVAAVGALATHVVGMPVPDRPERLAELHRRLVGDSQLRWLGPEKGVMHMAIGAVLNAAWDLASRRAGMPLWQYIAIAESRGTGRSSRLPSHQRRAHAETRRWRSCSAPSPVAASASSVCSSAATRRTPPRRAGWATTTPRSSGWRARPSPMGSR